MEEVEQTPILNVDSNRVDNFPGNAQTSVPESKQREMKKNKPFLNLFISILILGSLSFLLFVFYQKGYLKNFLPTSNPEKEKATVDVVKFSSADDFISYLQKGQDSLLEAGSLGVTGMVSIQEGVATKDSSLGYAPGYEGEIGRVSETNVQVKGIDEADIVKTDGQRIFYSQIYPFLTTKSVEPSIQRVETPSNIFPPKTEGETKIIMSYPPQDLEEKGKIDLSGDLLYLDNTLIVLSDQKISAFDVSNEAEPEKKWEYEYESNISLVSSRLYENKLFLVSRVNINQDRPCPIPLFKGSNSVTIDCSYIYHPRNVVPVDATFNIVVLDAVSGIEEKKIGFVGSSGFSVVYMSPNALYITYSYFGNIIEYLYNFFNENKDVLISKTGLDKLKNLKDLNISNQAKMTEFGIIIEEYYSSLTDNQRLKIQNDFQDKLTDYAKVHSRELEKTGIAKVDAQNLNVLATGEVPGRLLNQFSLDEYEQKLRLATTSSDAFSQGSINDVYILSDKLNLLGSVLGLGENERVYSVRFLFDKGYVVTFKETDPFYVLDLKDANNPKVKGELKIPGYSSYLHPVSERSILGIGKEENKVKISFFDVADAENPVEIDKYVLDEYWSDILNTHHAFLLDEKHQIFFLPGSQGGYVFSYRENKLELLQAISLPNAKRAIYINDFLYVLSDEEILVYDEYSWEQVGRLSF